MELAGSYLGAGLAIGLGALGGSIALSIAYAKTIECMARQPESAGAYRTLMFVAFAFIEAIALYALVISFMLVTKSA
jgi:F-type H+-transporting ATPase subunit c